MLINHIKKNNTLNSYDEIPNNFRRQIYQEEQQRSQKKSVDPGTFFSDRAPIHITNVLPSHYLVYSLAEFETA